MGNGTLISYRSNGPFYDHFCTKTDNVDFQVSTSQCHQNPKTTFVQIDIYPSSTICLSRMSSDIDDVISGTKSTTINWPYMASWESKV